MPPQCVYPCFAVCSTIKLCTNWSTIHLGQCGVGHASAPTLEARLKDNQTAHLKVTLVRNTSRAHGETSLESGQRLAIVGTSGTSVVLWSGRFVTTGTLVFFRLTLFKQKPSFSDAYKGGGAVHVKAGSFSSIASTFQSNEAAYFMEGGAIFFAASKPASNSSIIATLFQSNRARAGGALYMKGGVVAVIASLFLSNQALYGEGGAVYISDGIMSVKASSFRSNKAGVSSNSNGEGGAVFVGGGTLSVTLSSFQSNAASSVGDGGSAIAINGGSGVKVYMSLRDSTATFNDCSLCKSPSALWVHGGATASLDNMTFNHSVPTNSSTTDFGNAVDCSSKSGRGPQHFKLDGYFASLIVNSSHCS